jgi:pantoate--beta-alanine ligase
LSELYPDGTSALEHYDLGKLETLLEGKYRPGHFQGVCQVMRRLLDIIRPDDLFMGSKDYQQCMVIQRLLDIQAMSTVLHCCPIVREPDGLAMSSRNLRLNPEERFFAAGIHMALLTIRDAWAAGEAPDEMIAKATAILGETHFRIDYVSIADATTLEPLSSWQEEAVALIAAFQGEVRLIDNMNLCSFAIHGNRNSEV